MPLPGPRRVNHLGVRHSVRPCTFMERDAGRAVTKRSDHAERARLLRRVLRAIRAEDDGPADRAVRRRVEGAVIAEELAAGLPSPREAETGNDD